MASTGSGAQADGGVTASAVIVAAGSSRRLREGGGPEHHKPLVELEGLPILEHVLAAFDAARTVVEVILVAHPDDVAQLERWSAERPAFAKVRAIPEGGPTRTDSVRLGAFWCSFDVDVICVHDAARPLVAPELVDAAVERAHAEGAALVAVPVRDTIKVAREDDAAGEPFPRAASTLDRATLWAAQTPQAFRARRFRELLRRAEAEGLDATDDAALWERWVGPVPIVPGDPANLKVTTAADLVLAAALLRERARSSGGSAARVARDREERSA